VSLLDLTCSSIADLTTDYLERALEDDQELAFETHVVYCPGCSVFLDQIRTTSIRLRELPVPEPDEEERAALLAAYASRR
jgi:hypothetical protein